MFFFFCKHNTCVKREVQALAVRYGNICLVQGAFIVLLEGKYKSGRDI